ncbi:pyridine nucleotide-disulfide oxidoreductase [Klebsiella pneumoniae]|nr:pyridine nucleotide-disulfide oxidoreductase [Klebsiella pneumoniae]
MTVRIVIIGGGQAGGWAAKTLRDEGFSGEICVVAEEQWDFYERPPAVESGIAGGRTGAAAVIQRRGAAGTGSALVPPAAREIDRPAKIKPWR